MIPVLYVLVVLAAIVGTVMRVAYVVHRDGRSGITSGPIPPHPSRNPGEHENGTPR